MQMNCMACPPAGFTYLLMNYKSKLGGGYAVYYMARIQGKEGSGVCKSRGNSLFRVIYGQGKCSQK
jgi:hypothetical protein